MSFDFQNPLLLHTVNFWRDVSLQWPWWIFIFKFSFIRIHMYQGRVIKIKVQKSYPSYHLQNIRPWKITMYLYGILLEEFAIANHHKYHHEHTSTICIHLSDSTPQKNMWKHNYLRERLIALCTYVYICNSVIWSRVYNIVMKRVSTLHKHTVKL